MDNPISKESVISYHLKFNRFKAQIESGEHRLLMITGSLEIFANPQKPQKQEIKLEATISSVFQIRDIDNVLDLGDKQIRNKDLMLKIFEISYSTARGLIDSAAKGTTFHNALLPIVDPIRIATGFEDDIIPEFHYAR
jgi:hypothetical protein